MLSFIEMWRKEAIDSLFETSFNKTFNIWKPKIQKIIKGKRASDLFILGQHLAEIFTSTSEGGRAQGNLSAAGNSWECLVTWYLNLLMVGSRVVVIKHNRELVPKCVSDAITVMYGTNKSNTESDVIAIKFAEDVKDLSDLESLMQEDGVKFKVNGQINKDIPEVKNGELNIRAIINPITEECIKHVELAIIQCKTNWNDNAQIPMLWDMIYKAKDFKDLNIKVGSNGFSIDSMKDFSYAFATVPTNRKINKENIYKTSSTSVLRVSKLSGGNYWGYPSESGIAMNLNEFPDKVFKINSRLLMEKNLGEIFAQDSFFRLN